MNFPASQDDIKVFEDNNQVCINVYVIGERNAIIRIYG